MCWKVLRTRFGLRHYTRVSTKTAAVPYFRYFNVIIYSSLADMINEDSICRHEVASYTSMRESVVSTWTKNTIHRDFSPYLWSKHIYHANCANDTTAHYRTHRMVNRGTIYGSLHTRFANEMTPHENRNERKLATPTGRCRYWASANTTHITCVLLSSLFISIGHHSN